VDVVWPFPLSGGSVVKSPSKVGGLGQGVKYFPSNYGSGAPFGAPSPSPNANSAKGQLNFPNSLDGVAARILVSVVFNDINDPSATIDLQLYANTGSLAVPNYVLLANTGAAVPKSQPCHAFMIADIMGDSLSGVVNGTYYGLDAGGGFVSLTRLMTGGLLQGISYQGTPFGLVAAVQFGMSDSSNSASLVQLQVVEG
jgi:hypothetical protein